ncbi:PAS domain-containing hybrid sensor histidine kinase/response regulator [Ancylomarina sp. YFZ004]
MKHNNPGEKDKLEKIEKNYKGIFDSMAVMFQIIELIYDKNDKVIDYYYIQVNSAFEKLVNKKKAELIGKRAKDLFGIVENHWLKSYEKVDKTGKFESHENYGVELGKYYEINAWKVCDGQVAIAFTDVSKRKQAEQELIESINRAEQSEERFKLAMKASNDGLFDWNLETNDIYYSPAWKNMLGYQDHELPNDFSVWEERVNEEDSKKSWEHQQKLINKEIDRFVLEFKMKHKDGHWIDILSKAEAIFNDNGEAIRIVGTHTDITESNLLDLKLRDSQNYLSAVFNNTKDSQLLSRYEGIKKFKVIAANNSYINTINKFGFEHTEKDLTGKNLKELVIDTLQLERELFDYTVDYYQKAIDTKKQIIITESFILKEKPYYSETSYTPIFNSVDGKNYLLYNSRDITKETESIQLLQNSEEKYRLSMDATMDGLWDWNIQTGTVYFSPSYSKILGETSVNPEYESWLNRIHPDDREVIIASIQDHLKGNTDFWKREHRLRTKSGHWIWVFGRGSVVERDENGQAMRMVGTMANITERKKAALLLQKQTAKIEAQNEELNQTNEELRIAIERAELSEKMFKEYFNSSPNGIFVVDIDEENEYIFNSSNPISEKIIGFKNSELAGRNINVLLNKYDAELVDYVKNLYDKVVSSKESTTLYEERILLDKKVNLSTTIKPLLDENGHVYRLLGTNVDISKLKQTESELIEAKEKAEESDRLKSAFLSNMSHEIRTPMNGILGFAGLLKNPQLETDKQKKFIDIIEKSGIRMLNIINDIIDISKIEAGLMKIDLNESNINEQIEYIYTFFKPEIEEKGLKLTFNNTLPSEKSIIFTDREKVFAIITNLVKNAIKYTNYGSIEFGYNKKGANLEFYVKDTGIGIHEERLEAIFKRFIQADIVDKMALQGAGLGLSITKSYIEMLGGTIWVESEEGYGSTFYFTLPYQSEKNEEPLTDNVITLDKQDQIIPPEVEGLNILIAEDDEISDSLLTISIEKFSNKIIKVTNGIEAVEACRNNSDIDLILMDIKMPKMDGYEATKQIRQFNKVIIIIAQTAYGLARDRKKALESGCNDYIAKPINTSTLLTLIQKHFCSRDKL